ncbi:alpha/beta hydrolase [Aporhodopirellula aestuarii]|uniref:Alpha/beta hydrolase n=1 Tax=Aporhodopirellula aestuarii TaxID=2950107 RepID=A0ABT0U4G8_9BACT|nr:alpha/beta hydrolase [Aporhodopirellula aestuarii]MCM2371333.1 alpha/beta hydrolase [Aporhodopirellula aestuarii]
MKASLMEEATSAKPESSAQSAKSPVRFLWHRTRRAITSIAVAYGVLCVAMVLLETRLVFPGAYMGPPSSDNGPQFDPDAPITNMITTFAYRAVDEAELKGRLLIRSDADRVILFLHGNGIRAMDMDGWTRLLSDAMNASVFTAEYRGFQNEGFTPTESTCVSDALSAMDALSELTRVPPEQITIYGRSLGGGIAAGLVELLQERNTPPHSLVLDRTFDSTVNVGADRFTWLPVQWLMRNRFDSSSRLSDFQGCVVQIHGTPDRIVPMKNGRQLFDSLATRYKAWVEVPGLYHNDPISKQPLERALEELRKLEGLRQLENQSALSGPL